MSKGKLIKSSAIVMVLIILGKICAIFRDALVANKFGVTYISDMYTISLGVVYLLTTVSYGLTTTFIPIHTEYMQKTSKEKANKFVNNVLNVYTLFTIIVIIILMLFSKQIIYVFAHELTNDKQIFNTSIDIIRIMVLSLIFISIQSVITGVLQAHNEFYEPAAMSLASNLVFIIYLIFFTSKFGIYGFAISTVIGFLVQLIINLPKYKKLGYKYEFCFNIFDKDLKKIVILMTPIIISTSLLQLNLFINRAFAANIYYGAATILDFSNKINTLAYEVFAIGIAMVVYPTLSSFAAEGNEKEYKNALVQSINIILLIMVPASVAIGVLRMPLITLIFKSGAFGNNAVDLTSNALLFYCPAMIAYGLRDILNKAFYAIKDTRTPMINSFIGIVINIIINIILIKYMKVSGLTLATSISIIIVTILMLLNLDKKLNKINLKDIFISFMKITIASIIMGIFICVINNICLNYMSLNKTSSLISLVICMIIGSIVYFLVIYVLKLNEFVYLIDVIKNKLKK